MLGWSEAGSPSWTRSGSLIPDRAGPASVRAVHTPDALGWLCGPPLRTESCPPGPGSQWQAGSPRRAGLGGQTSFWPFLPCPAHLSRRLSPALAQLWAAASSRLGGRRLSPLSDSPSLVSLLWPTQLPVPVALTLLRHTELPSRAGRLLCLRTHHVTEPPNSHPAFRPEFTSPRGFLLPRGESVTYSFTCALRVALLGADVA